MVLGLSKFSIAIFFVFSLIYSVWGFSSIGPSFLVSLGPCRILHFTSSQKPLLAPLRGDFIPMLCLILFSSLLGMNYAGDGLEKLIELSQRLTQLIYPSLESSEELGCGTNVRKKQNSFGPDYPRNKGTSQVIFAALNILLHSDLIKTSAFGTLYPFT